MAERHDELGREETPEVQVAKRVGELSSHRTTSGACSLIRYQKELTTFGTPYLWAIRLETHAFGISVAPEVFQKKLHDMVENLEGIWARSPVTYMY